VIILVLVPKTAPGAFLQVVSAIRSLCLKTQTSEELAAFENPRDIWTFFEKTGVVLPEYLRACDIMDPMRIYLDENDSLERAINLFAKHRLSELPVVDKEGELLGVVTTYELLRVVLPDYILWMDDLCPILKFEPFGNVLKMEADTWLKEIMTDRLAVVAHDAPAIKAVVEIARKDAGSAYIVENKKLVGVISQDRFMSKVLRE
jgi:CBS-domain-containing membrane protein